MAHSFRSKHAKYASTNPVSRVLVGGFYRTIDQMVAGIEFDSVVDVGCGEGLLLRSLESRLSGVVCHALDADPAEAEDAAANLPFCNVRVGSAYDMPMEDNSVDLVICTEVLEHLAEPRRALEEFARVSRRYVLMSVPREPIWRMLNMARGAYWSGWGNTPDHLNHWSSRGFRRFVSTRFDVVQVLAPFPWTLVLGVMRGGSVEPDQ